AASSSAAGSSGNMVGGGPASRSLESMGLIVHARVLHRSVTRTAGQDAPALPKDPWPALWALVVGFFMVLVDQTIVAVATPALIEDLHADVNDVLWVTSAYLLAYAVPVLI